MRLAFLLAAIAAAALLPPTLAAAQAPAPLACPENSDVLLSFQPDFARQSGTFEAYVKPARNTDPARLANITVAVRGGSSAQLTADGTSSHAVLAAPESGAAFELVFQWDQDAGTPAACHGTDTYSIPLAKPGDRVGDPATPRLTGELRMTFTGLNFRERPARVTWTLRPSCDLFACATRLRSTTGFTATLRLSDGRYVVTSRSRVKVGTFTCDKRVNGVLQSRVNAYDRSTTRTVLEVIETRGGLAYRVRGHSTTTFARTSEAQAQGCPGKTYEERVRGTRAHSA